MTEEQLNAALVAWLNEPAGLPGQNQATLLALNSGWTSCTTDAQRVTFLSTYAPFATIYAAATPIVDNLVFWVGIDMIVDAVLREAQKLREQDPGL